MITNFKLYENFKKPKIGDYVVGVPMKFKYETSYKRAFVNKNIGKIIDKYIY